ncbi:UNVERIFIED_ORG: hypothetical protein J2Y77_005826 [Pseudomonas lini]
MSELTIKPTFSLAPQNIEEALKFADYLAKSTIVPKDFQNNPGNILVAIQWGMELGLQAMQAMQNIAVINGRPSLWGDAVLALVLSFPACEDVVEYYEGDPKSDDYTAVCIAKRKGRADKKSTFSLSDARLAGLLDKQGPWKQYRDRMLKMRARSFALRDQFADVLKGMPMAEEVQDIPTEREIGPAREAEAKVLPAYPADKLAENLPKWRTAIESKRTTPEAVIGTISSKYVLTPEQTETINQLKPLEGVTA